MKKFFALLLTLSVSFLLFSFTACDAKKKEKSNNVNFKAVSIEAIEMVMDENANITMTVTSSFFDSVGVLKKTKDAIHYKSINDEFYDNETDWWAIHYQNRYFWIGGVTFEEGDVLTQEEYETFGAILVNNYKNSKEVFLAKNYRQEGDHYRYVGLELSNRGDGVSPTLITARIQDGSIVLDWHFEDDNMMCITIGDIGTTVLTVPEKAYAAARAALARE